MDTRYIELLLAQHQGDHQNGGDFRATVNLMALFCTASELDQFGDHSTRVCRAMASILQIAGPAIRLEQAARNLDLRRRLPREVLEHGSYEKAIVAISGDVGLGSERLRRIGRGEFADTTLGEFIEAAIRDLARTEELEAAIRDSGMTQEREAALRRSSITQEQLKAAQERIAKIRRLMLTKNNKGGEIRKKLGLNGWRELGRTRLDEDIFDEVEKLLLQGVKPGAACERIARATGDHSAMIKTTHQRIKTERQSNLEAAAKAAGVRPLEIQEALKTGELVTDPSE